MNLKEIQEVIKLMEENDIREFEMERDGFKLVLKRGQAPVQEVAVSRHVAVEVPAQASVESPAAAEAPAPEGNLEEIVSPMVGTFYAAPSPESPPFAKKGDKIAPGDVVCIVEAMKVMNEIKAEIGGTIMEVLVENGQTVEFNQPLFRVTPG